MPCSSSEGKAFTRKHLDQLRPAHIIDVGAGAGLYAHMIHELDPKRYRPTVWAVEAWAPYVQRFSLTNKYHAVILADARKYMATLAETRFKCSAVILGDILEHMTKAEALALWMASMTVSDELTVLSIPIVHYPQGAEEGNPYEAHVKDDWSHEEVMDTFPGITDSWQGSEVGVYIARVW